MLLKLSTVKSVNLAEVIEIEPSAITIISGLALMIGLFLLAISLIAGLCGADTIELIAGAIIVSLVSLIVFASTGSPSNKETIKQRNNEISQILENKYEVELIDPIYGNFYKITPEQITEETHKIINREGLEQIVTIKISENKQDLIVSTKNGEIPTVSENDESVQEKLKPIN